MDIIIQQFHKKVTSELEKQVEKIFIEGDSDITEVINILKDCLDELDSNIIKNFLEECDQRIKESTERKKIG